MARLQWNTQESSTSRRVQNFPWQQRAPQAITSLWPAQGREEQLFQQRLLLETGSSPILSWFSLASGLHTGGAKCSSPQWQPRARPEPEQSWEGCKTCSTPLGKRASSRKSKHGTCLWAGQHSPEWTGRTGASKGNRASKKNHLDLSPRHTPCFHKTILPYLRNSAPTESKLLTSFYCST